MARSSVFAAMFRNEMAEKKTNEVFIEDCDTESFQEFLQYLYTGRIENITFDMAYHLYTTADKYDVQKLKKFCVQYMSRSVTAENVCDIAVLAEELGEMVLLDSAQQFFNENIADIFRTNKWKSLLREKVTLVEKLLLNMTKDYW